MQLQIRCPICSKKIGNKDFAEFNRDHDIYCHNCNTQLTVALIDYFPPKDKQNDGVNLRITIEPAKDLVWKMIVQEPVLLCLVCQFKERIGRMRNSEDEVRICRSCGATYFIEFDFEVDKEAVLT